MVARRIDLVPLADVPSGGLRAGGSAFRGSFDPTGSTFWLAPQGRDTVVRVDVATATIAVRRPFTRAECIAPHEAIHHAGLDRVFVVCEGDHEAPGRLLALDPTTLDIVGMV